MNVCPALGAAGGAAQNGRQQNTNAVPKIFLADLLSRSRWMTVPSMPNHVDDSVQWTEIPVVYLRFDGQGPSYQQPSIILYIQGSNDGAFS